MKSLSLGALVMLFCLVTAGCAPTAKELDLMKPDKVIARADLDYRFLNNIDNITPPYPAGSRYQIGDLPTVKGQYTIYKYIFEYKGESAERGKQTFHDLVVLKVDPSGKILDAYQYTLEWADSPSLALKRAENRTAYLKPGLKLEDLKMASVAVSARREGSAPEQKLASPPGENIRLGDEFKKDEKALEQKAGEIIRQAQSYEEAEERLRELQRQADSSWKGHGPQILDKALKRLKESKI